MPVTLKAAHYFFKSETEAFVNKAADFGRHGFCYVDLVQASLPLKLI